jgi:hypothetical protein
MKTRKQYMNNECTHAEYYNQFVDDSVLLRVKRMVGQTRIVESKDESFNDIPLRIWDSIGITSTTGDKMREAEDYPTLAGTVCINKAAARQIRDEYKSN